jgi:hypothetical protein
MPQAFDYQKNIKIITRNGVFDKNKQRYKQLCNENQMNR